MITPRHIAGLVLLALAAGCQQFPQVTDAPPLAPGEYIQEHNPVYIPLGPGSYGTVFENVLTVLGDYGLEVMESNRYDGRIETLPRVAPGLGQFFRPGSPGFYDRLLYTAQSYRHRVSVIIQPADNGGYFVEVIVRKELEDLPRPVRMTAGGAIFRTDNNVDRSYEVIDANIYEPTWIYRGRDDCVEQELIRRLKGCM